MQEGLRAKRELSGGLDIKAPTHCRGMSSNLRNERGSEQRPALIFARFLRCQITSLFDSVEIEPRGGKLGDLPSASGGQCDVENLGSHKATNCAFVHGKKAAAHPIPTLVIMHAVDSNLDLQLGLSPPAGPVRR